MQPVADERGRSIDTYRASWLPFAKPMVQANGLSLPPRTLRGLHYHRRQADLWFVQSGRVTVVLVDARVASPTEGKHTTLQLGEGEEMALYVPEGIAHGFYAHHQVAMTYLATSEYDGSDELGVAWNDPELGILWPDPGPVLSERDRQNPPLAEISADRRVPYTG